MGIDKRNIRKIIHWGMPSTIESYYQGAGRAGRDGLPAHCLLYYNENDAGMQIGLKSNTFGSQISMSQPAQRGVSMMLSYCSSSTCRHAVMVNHFSPDSFQYQSNGKCAGGCDNCDSKDNKSSVRDVTKEMRLFLQAIAATGITRKAILLLRGSMAKDITDNPRFLQVRSPDGILVHGSGKHRPELWWKGVEDIAVANNFIVKETKAFAASTFVKGYILSSLNSQGINFLHSQSILECPLTKEMREIEEQEAALIAQQEELKARQATLKQQNDKLRPNGGMELMKLLVEVRREEGIKRNLPPELVVSDAALVEIIFQRPKSLDSLRECEGCGDVFIAVSGNAFIEALVQFEASNTKASVPMEHKSRKKELIIPEELLKGKRDLIFSNETQQLARSLLASEVKGSQLKSLEKFNSSNTITLEDIANGNEPKPIKTSTVLGYIADAAACGYAVDLDRIQNEIKLSAEYAGMYSEVICRKSNEGIGAVKREMDKVIPDADYGHIKLVCIAIVLQALWFAPDHEDELDESSSPCESVDQLHAIDQSKDTTKLDDKDLRLLDMENHANYSDHNHAKASDVATKRVNDDAIREADPWNGSKRLKL